MDALFQVVLDLFAKTLLQVWVTFTHNWPFLIVSILIGVILKLYLDQDKVSAFLLRHQRAGVLGATAAAVGTPLCSCGTTAVILGMMAGSLPWAPIIAFMVASPLTSPEELVYSAGLFGWPFALAFFGSSILLGLLGGLVAGILEKRGWFTGQTRYTASNPAKVPSGLPVALSNVRPPTRVRAAAAACCAPAPALALAVEPCGCDSLALMAPAPACACSAAAIPAPTVQRPANGPAPRVTARIFLGEVYQMGKQLLPMFVGFAFIGYFLNNLIPAAWVSAVFGKGNVYSVPLAATLGLPLYINTEASLPLVRALIDGGMSQGAALAFLITGAGTSIGAMVGALTIARWRVIGLVVAVLWVGAIASGFVFDLLLAARII
ncbi:MAG TPA: permease [Anaerolineaceae bacterium]